MEKYLVSSLYVLSVKILSLLNIVNNKNVVNFRDFIVLSKFNIQMLINIFFLQMYPFFFINQQYVYEELCIKSSRHFFKPMGFYRHFTKKKVKEP